MPGSEEWRAERLARDAQWHPEVKRDRFGQRVELDGWVIEWSDDEDTSRRIGCGQIDAQKVHEEALILYPRVINLDTNLDPEKVKDPVRFELRDEDDYVFFRGRITKSWLDSEEFGMAPQRFGEADVGATDIWFKAEDLDPEFVEAHEKIGCVKAGWVMVFS